MVVGHGEGEVWLTKLDPQGNAVWSDTLDLVPDEDDRALAVTIGGDHTVFVVGRQGGDGQAADSFVAAYSG